MQWLIDIIQEWIIAQGYLTVGFVDRGDPAAVDYATGVLTKNGVWRDLDLSAIVPENAKGVALRVLLLTAEAGISFSLRKKGHTLGANISQQWTTVALEFVCADMIVACDENRIIQYHAAAATWLVLDITVKNWWF